MTKQKKEVRIYIIKFNMDSLKWLNVLDEYFFINKLMNKDYYILINLVLIYLKNK